MSSTDQIEKIFLDVFPIRVHLLTNGQRIGGSATRVQYVWASSSLSARHMQSSKSEIRSFYIDYRKFLDELAQSIEYDLARDALGWVHQLPQPDSVPCFLEIIGEKMLHEALATLVNSSRAGMEAVDLYTSHRGWNSEDMAMTCPRRTTTIQQHHYIPMARMGSRSLIHRPHSEHSIPAIEIPKLKHENNDIPPFSLPALIFHTQKCRSSATKRVNLSPPTGPPESSPR